MQKDHIPLGVGFYPDWFYTQYGIPFGREYYFDPKTRVEARMEIDRRLYERFGDVGLGNPDPQPKPLITFGMVMLPSVFGCEIVYKDDALPWAMPLNLSEDEVMKLEVPDIFHSYPMTEMIRQIDYLREKYGKVVGDINTTGVQNLALKIRGDQLYIDFFENPALCRHLLRICAQCMIRLFEFNRKTTGTGVVDVTPMCDPRLCVLPNCTAEQISLETYEDHVLEYDNQVADACHPVGERFEKKKIFVPEMMMAAKSMQACVDLLTPLLKKEESAKGLGTVVLGTVFGDLHDIGKNLTRLLLETSGFRVIDLGENVPAAKFVEAAREHKAHIVGLSSLLTTGDPHVKETIQAIKHSDLKDRVKVICGGAALTLKFVETCGADAHARDAADGIKKIKALLGIED